MTPPLDAAPGLATLEGMHKPKVAIVLFNLGGPDKPASVRPFLVNLFKDPAILRVPFFIRPLAGAGDRVMPAPRPRARTMPSWAASLRCWN